MHVTHPYNGHIGYIMTSTEYALVSMDPYREAEDTGEFCKVPRTARTKTEQRNAERKWTAKHERHSTFQNIVTVLTTIFEEVIGIVCHSGGVGMSDKGFGMLTPRGRGKEMVDYF